MAESVTIARPYAQAVFRLAQESGTLAAWSNRLQRLALIAQDAEMAKVVGNPKFSAAQVTELFVSLSGEASGEELKRFISVLAENERLGVLAEISGIFEDLKSASEGLRELLVESAFPLDDAQLKKLVGELEPVFGGKLEPRVEVDSSLIGGVRVSVGDQVLDTSVRGKLEAMVTALKN